MLTNLAIGADPGGTVSLPQSSGVHDFVREGCNVINGSVVGAVIGAALCPVPGGPELGATIGGWLGSKLTEGSKPASK